MIKTNGERLWNSLMEMAKIGPGSQGGNKRLALSDADVEGRSLFRKWVNEAGCTCRMDSMGNLFARREGVNSQAAPVIVGSHLDTQPSGGRFDGILGVLGGLEVIRSLNDHGIKTECPVEVAVWTNEEGARFPPAMMGSGVFAGVFEQAEMYAQKDPDGISVETELRRTQQIGDSACQQFPIEAYYELHIEQGPVLDAEKTSIGVVTGGQGIQWIHVTLKGQASHAGTTPMNYRKDPLAGATRIISGFRELIIQQTGAVGTVGRLDVFPASINTVPDEVFFTVDIRHPHDSILDDLQNKLHELIFSVSNEETLEFDIDDILRSPSIRFDETCISNVRTAAEMNGLSHRDIVSGAGHDACYLAKITPTAMIFIPCDNGLSHNEAENISPEQAASGADVLLNAVISSAKIV